MSQTINPVRSSCRVAPRPPRICAWGLVGRWSPVLLFATAGCVHPRPEPLRVTQDGRSDYAIVRASAPTEAETFAAAELAEFIRRATGVTLPVVDEAAHGQGRAIYLGWTEFARRQGLDPARLGPEQWVLRAVGDNLVLAGGRPRGTLYAVYEFLERDVGVRFLDAKTEFVPATAALSIPADLDRRGAPAFERREIMSGRGLPFDVRLRINSSANGWQQIGARYGYSLKYGSPYTTHSIPRYIKDFPDAFNRDEHFALNEGGKRYHEQVCMSHPEVRQIVAARLREYIRRDRQAIRDAGTGDPYPTYYALVPDDGSAGRCVCEGCKALAAKHGSYAGVVLDFVNTVAADIAAEHPEVVLATCAYTYYRDIPTGIVPRDNVMVVIAQLGSEFNTAPKRDTLRGMLHRLNAGPRAEWEGWSKISPRLGVHDYWGPWSQQAVWPYVNVRGTAETIAFYHRCGLDHFFVEAALSDHIFYSFPDLQFYVGARLLLDPTQPVEPLLEEFMRLYYGPAAPVMRRLLDYIEARQTDEPGYLASVPPRNRKYFDPPFFVETDALLAEAERLAGNDSNLLARVRQERLPLDETMLLVWDTLARQADWPFARDAVAARLERSYAAVHAKYGFRSMSPEFNRAKLEYLRADRPLPPQFAGKQLLDLCGPMLTLVSGAGRFEPKGRAADAEAVIGHAWRITSRVWTADRPAEHEKPPEFGVSDCEQTPKFLVRRVLSPKEIPTDERYHWYRIGRMQATPSMYFYAHHSWVFDQRLYAAYNAALPEQKFYDVHVSLKLEGPAYVPGSTKENAFSIDRLILEEVPRGEEAKAP